MENGLDITEKEFLKMAKKDRDLIIFKNLTHVRKKLGNYAFNKKIQYTWLSVLTLFTGLRRFIGA